MPTLTAALAASLVGWLVESPVRAMFGPVTSIAVSLLVSTLVFLFAKRFLTDLRSGS